MRQAAAAWEARVGAPGQGWFQASSRLRGALWTLQGGGLQSRGRKAHCGQRGAFPQPRGSPCVGTGGGGKKSLKPKAKRWWLQKGCPQLLDLVARFAALNGQVAAAVCAKFWVARKGAGEGQAQRCKLCPES